MESWVYCGTCAKIEGVVASVSGQGQCPGCRGSIEVSKGEDVFISFSFADMQPALETAAALRAAKIRFWLAPLAEGIGDDFVVDIEEALQQAKVLLLLASPHAARSNWVRREIAMATNRNLTVMAVKLDRFTLPPGWEFSLSTTIWVDAFLRPFDEVLGGVVVQLKKKLGDVAAARLAPREGREPAIPQAPLKGVDREVDRYVGPRPYQRNQRSLFFGRDEDAMALLDQLRDARSVLIYAPSGAGKSSFINTLLRDRLEESGAEVLEGGRLGAPLPGKLKEDDLENVYSFQAICGLNHGALPPAGRTLAKHLAGMPRNKASGERVLLLDQFEELFTHYDHEKRPGFFADIIEALRADPKLRVIFGMRQEYLANFYEQADRMPRELRPVEFRLNRLGERAALDVITKPVADYVTFAPGVAEHVVDHLSSRKVEGRTGTRRKRSEFIELVHLQIVCQRLWRSLQPGITRIDMKDLERAAGEGKSFDQFVDNVLDEFLKQTVEEVGAKKDFPPELIELGLVKFVNAAGARVTIQMDRQRGRTGRLPNEIVHQLEESHLLRVETRGDERWYELSHDLLVEPVRRNNDRKVAALLATTDLLSTTLQKERGDEGGRLAGYFRPHQDLLRECEPLHARAILFADEAEFVFRASLGSSWQTTEWSRRLGQDFPEIQVAVLREALHSPLAPVRANAVSALGAVPVPELDETLVEMSVLDPDEGVRTAAAESIAVLDQGPVFQRLIERLQAPATRPNVVTALAVVLNEASDRQTTGFEGHYRSLEGGVRKWVRRESRFRRLRQHTATLIYAVIPASILSGIGAGLFKWIPTAFNMGITQPTASLFMGLYQGFVAGAIWGGVISFVLTFHQVVFTRRRYRDTFWRPFGAIPYGMLSGVVSGVLVSTLIMVVYQVHSLRNIGWIASETTTAAERWRQAFFETRFGLSFVISGTFLGGALALVSNRVRSSKAWLDFRASQTELTGIKQARRMLAGIARLALPHAWPIAIALALACPFGWAAARRPAPPVRCDAEHTTNCSNDPYIPKGNGPWIVAKDIMADYGCQITGGFGVIVGMGFGLVVVGKGIHIPARQT